MTVTRDFQINGESLVLVKGRQDSSINTISQLGLADSPIIVTPQFNHKDLHVDAWGQAPADVQWMLGTLTVRMSLIHFDPAVLNTCIALSMGGSQPTFGQFARAGTRMGGNFPRFAAGNNYIGLNIASPVLNFPWRFFYAYLMDPPASFPLGVEAEIVPLNWRVVPYTQDPANIIGGIIYGATDYPLWDNVLDT